MSSRRNWPTVIVFVFIWHGIATAQGTLGIITTIAGATAADGSPQRGYSGDGGPGTGALLALANLRNACFPIEFLETTRLAVDADGNVYVPDSGNHRVRRIAPDGLITTVAGTGERPEINNRCDPTSEVGEGPALSSKLYNPSDVAIDREGNLIIADQLNHRIRRVSPAGSIETIVGSGFHNVYAPGALALNSPIDYPASVAIDPNGRLHFAEPESHRIARVNADGRLVTVAGTGFPGFSGDNVSAVSARLSSPAGITFDAAGNLYISDRGNHRVRKVAPNGTISTVAGTGEAGYSGDGGSAERAQLNSPNDVKVDREGNIYIADMRNHRIRCIDPRGVITTVAGDGRAGRGPDGGAATSSSLNFPSGVAVDRNGTLYIVDWQNYLIRKVTFSRVSARLDGIANGASFRPSPDPLAVGSIITILGDNLASSTASATATPLPTQLEGVGVLINGRPAPLFFVSPRQINAQLPYETTVGSAVVRVNSGAGTSAEQTIEVVAASPGIFQHGGSTRGVIFNQDGTVNSSENPAAPGSAIVAYLTGIGAVDQPVETGAAAPLDTLVRLLTPASATIGGIEAAMQFVGLTPGTVGVGQANIEVPRETPQGPEVALVIKVGERVSNTVTFAVR